jgi:hypothetical protein
VTAAAPFDLLTEGTGGGRPHTATTGRLVPLLPVGFALAGALTGATVAQAPPSSLDWTSAQRHAVMQAWEPQHAPLAPFAPVATAAVGAARGLLEGVKHESGLTWNQIAGALGVDVRALHLWRNGGGISARHEARLHELSFLVDSVALEDPAEARTELIDAKAGRSVLERFGAGESGSEAALAAPWRHQARQGLGRSAAAVRSGEPIDEDFLFLLYTDPAETAALVAHLGGALDEPATSRREWERHLDVQFGQVEQPAAAAAPVLLENDHDAAVVAPLFEIDELAITLGVGAIASRPTLHGEA